MCREPCVHHSEPWATLGHVIALVHRGKRCKLTTPAQESRLQTRTPIILPMSTAAFSSPAPEWDGQGLGLCPRLGGSAQRLVFP